MDRGRVLQLALENISAKYKEQPMIVVEVGCSFGEKEGLSTYLIADFLMKREVGGKLFSIDIENEHIERCKALIKERDPTVLDIVEFRQGHSVYRLPEIIKEIEKAHLFYLDGGAHPEVCLYEFELAQTSLYPHGLIIVDDVQSIDSSAWFPDFPLPLGKATLIYPYLLISNYLKCRGSILKSREDKSLPPSSFIEGICKTKIPEVSAPNYTIIGRIYWHAMLLYGDLECIEYIKKIMEKDNRN